MKWIVSVPIYGCASIFVEADDEASAIEKARSGEWSENPEIDEWDISERCRGKVCGRTMHDDFYAKQDA